MSDSDNDPLPDDVLLRLLQALDTGDRKGPSAELRARVLERIRPESAAADITTVRSDDGEWSRLAAGVMAKVLNDDGRTRTWLARMDTGARLPGHPHAGDEESFLLEGTCVLGGVLMRPGDYQLAREGTWHGEVTTDTGCLLFVRSRSPAAAQP